MIKYKVNLKFKENGKSLNEILTDVLKIELNKKINEVLVSELTFSHTKVNGVEINVREW